MKSLHALCAMAVTLTLGAAAVLVCSVFGCMFDQAIMHHGTGFYFLAFMATLVPTIGIVTYAASSPK